MDSAIFRAWSSLSMTQGPAMRNRRPPPMVTSPTWNSLGREAEPLPIGHALAAQEHLYFRSLFIRAAFHAVLVRSPDKRLEQRMRLKWLRFELGVELAANEVGVIGNFDHLHVGSVGS